MVTDPLYEAQLKLIRLGLDARGGDGRPLLTRTEIAAALGISLLTYHRRLRALREREGRLRVHRPA